MKPNKKILIRLTAANGLVAILLSFCLFFNVKTSMSINLMTKTLLVCKCWLAVLLCSTLGISLFTFGTQMMKIQNAARGIFVCGIATILFHIITVLFGAPVSENVSETFHFALILMATTLLPVCCIRERDTGIMEYLNKFFSLKLELGLESVTGITAGCSLLGAWLGAFPIPLDWDRPWQVWPISCVIGNLLGYIAGLVLSGVHYHYQYNALQKIKIT